MGITTLLKSHCNICVLIMMMMAMSSVNAADMNATSAFIDGFLVPHNEARNAVGVGPLQWDSKLANYARNYARQTRGDCLLQHSDTPFGENIFWGSGHGWTPSQAVAAWIDEKKWFDYAKNICSGPDCRNGLTMQRIFAVDLIALTTLRLYGEPPPMLVAPRLHATQAILS